jgi:hypothetical protein
VAPSRFKIDPKALGEARREIDLALELLAQSFAEDGAGTLLENVWLENLRLKATQAFWVTEGSC